jgi:hypothetical protein
MVNFLRILPFSCFYGYLFAIFRSYLDGADGDNLIFFSIKPGQLRIQDGKLPLGKPRRQNFSYGSHHREAVFEHPFFQLTHLSRHQYIIGHPPLQPFAPTTGPVCIEVSKRGGGQPLVLVRIDITLGLLAADNDGGGTWRYDDDELAFTSAASV